MVKQVIRPPIERLEKLLRCPSCGKRLRKIEVITLRTGKSYICKKCGKAIF